MIGIIRRREFVAIAPALLAGATVLPACAQAPDPESYASVAAQIRRVDDFGFFADTSLLKFAGIPISCNLEAMKPR